MSHIAHEPQPTPTTSSGQQASEPQTYECAKCHTVAEAQVFRKRHTLPVGWVTVSVQGSTPDSHRVLCAPHAAALRGWLDS